MSISVETQVTLDSEGGQAKGRFSQAVKLVSQIVRIHPRYFITAVSGATVFAICTVASAVGLQWVIDHVVLVRFNQGRIDRSAMIIGSILIVGIGLVKAGGVIVRRSFAGMTEWHTAGSITNQVLDHVIAQPVKWHRQKMAGDVVARSGVDADATVVVLAPMPFASSVLVMMVVSAIWMLVVDYRLGLVAVGVFPVLVAMNIGFQRRVDRFYDQAQKELGTLSEAVHESFDGVLVVKAFGAEARETVRLASITARLRDARISAVRVRSSFEAMVDLVPGLVNILLIVLGAMRVKSGAMTVGELSSFAYMFTLMMFPLRIIGHLFSEIPHSVAGWRRVREILDEKLLDNPLAKIKVAPSGIAIEISELEFGHNDEHRLLTGLNLTIASGRTIAVVGQTGCGKTTLLHLIAGLIEPRSGTVALQSGGVGLVFQEAFLFAESLRFNLTLDQKISDEAIALALQLSECTEFVNELPQGLATIMGERGSTLSGGQRQRIALARAIAQNRRILLLDDTTSALDPETEARVVANLRNMQSNTTVVIVASRPSTIALADEVLFLDGGVIADHAPHATMLQQNEKYLELISAFEHDRASIVGTQELSKGAL